MSSNGGPLLDLPATNWTLGDGSGLSEFEPHLNASNVVRIGVIGYGYWGPNIVRNFHGVDGCQVVALCDKSRDALRRAHRTYPRMRLTTDLTDILHSPD